MTRRDSNRSRMAVLGMREARAMAVEARELDAAVAEWVRECESGVALCPPAEKIIAACRTIGSRADAFIAALAKERA